MFSGAPGPDVVGLDPEPDVRLGNLADPEPLALPVGRTIVEFPETVVVSVAVSSADDEVSVAGAEVVDGSSLLSTRDEAVLPEMVKGPR